MAIHTVNAKHLWYDRSINKKRGTRLKIVIFNLGICDAARPKVPANLDAACAAE